MEFVSQKEESYTSQCSPLSPEVGKRYAEPSKRKERGLYRDGNRTYNADAVGAYNILRKYHSVSGVKKELSVTGLKTHLCFRKRDFICCIYVDPVILLNLSGHPRVLSCPGTSIHLSI